MKPKKFSGKKRKIFFFETGRDRDLHATILNSKIFLKIKSILNLGSELS